MYYLIVFRDSKSTISGELLDLLMAVVSFTHPTNIYIPGCDRNCARHWLYIGE
jgi:hypothetical protein